MFEKRGGRKKCKTFPLRKRRFARRKGANAKKDWSRAAYPPQRSLRAALGCCPTTAGGAQFCLLCCQPGPVPESLPARPPPLTKGRPCRPPVWLGHPIHTASRTCHGPQRFISQVPMRGTGRHDPPQRKRHRAQHVTYHLSAAIGAKVNRHGRRRGQGEATAAAPRGD